MTQRILLALFLVVAAAVLLAAVVVSGAPWFLAATALISLVSGCVSLYSAIRCRDLSEGKPWQPSYDRRLW